jgi:phytoene/squalene synthetase
MPKPLSYCAAAVYDHNRDRFWQSLFVVQPARESLYAVLALDVELAHIRRAVKEEVMGHMRHAWWQESLGMIINGGRPREHPVFQAMASLINDGLIPKEPLMRLMENYRAAFPELPLHQEPLEALCLSLLPKSDIKAWKDAGAIIQKHRTRFGNGKNSWLMIKLLCAGAGR